MHPPLLHGHWRLQVAIVESHLESLPKENAEAVQWLLYRARTGMKLGATAAPIAEEHRGLIGGGRVVGV